nr:hypothetical protein [Tanacetum cinerariifolium]
VKNKREKGKIRTKSDQIKKKREAWRSPKESKAVSNSFDCPPDSYHPLHPTHETYSGDTCGNNSQFGYDCPPQFLLNYEPEPRYIQNYNSYPHDSPRFPQQYPCCEDCGLPVCYDDDDDEEGYNSLNDNIIFELPSYSVVTLTEPIDSLIIISSKIDSLFDEFTGELTLLKSFLLRIDEHDCHPEKEIRLAKRLLYDNLSPCLPEEIVSDISNADIESFSPSPIPNEDSDSHIEEIDLSFNPDDPMPPGIEDDDYDSGRDIPILEELLDNYSLSLPTNESYHFIPSSYHPPTKPPDSNTGTLNIKMMGDVSDQKVLIPNLTITRVLNQEKSLDLLSHLGFKVSSLLLNAR